MMPIIFIGHGSPMNIVEDNSYTRMLSALGKSLPQPKAILVISAHWLTEGTQVLSVAKPKTIYDFHGFPDELYKVSYPAPGAPELANRIKEIIPNVKETQDWGLDHGAWAILHHLYPDADIPVTQMSIDRKLSLQGHFELGEKLKALRNEGVLIIGSGNIVHNLRAISWDTEAPAHEWATDFDGLVKEAIGNSDFEFLMSFRHPKALELFRMAHPTADHYIPLMYVLGGKETKDSVQYPIELMQNASISMRSIIFS
jgi:4,5-DOPA dioxygenase extradiol